MINFHVSPKKSFYTIFNFYLPGIYASYGLPRLAGTKKKKSITLPRRPAQQSTDGLQTQWVSRLLNHPSVSLVWILSLFINQMFQYFFSVLISLTLPSSPPSADGLASDFTEGIETIRPEFNFSVPKPMYLPKGQPSYSDSCLLQ